MKVNVSPGEGPDKYGAIYIDIDREVPIKFESPCPTCGECEVNFIVNNYSGDFIVDGVKCSHCGNKGQFKVKDEVCIVWDNSLTKNISNHFRALRDK
jgi:hypothetical protein